MSKILKKQYFRISFELASPLSIGSGLNASTDRDIIKDANGIPFIPGTAIAGVCRDLLEKTESEAVINKYLGIVRTDGSGEAIGSKIVFYDAKIISKADQIRISKRDSVALDEYKTAKKGAKFDMEVLEPGGEFVTYIEQNFYDDCNEAIAEKIARLWQTKKVMLGGKTMRGYGAIGATKISKCGFDMQKEEDVLKWLSFDMYSSDDMYALVPNYKSDNICNNKLRLEIKQRGGISIRKYTTDVSTETETMPDYEQLLVNHMVSVNDQDVIKALPTIPGTSWSGSFLHHMKNLDSQYDYEKVFGNTSKKSLIGFSETVLKNATEKTMTRNAIDRFSGGTANGALFTDKTYYGGATTLTISFAKEWSEADDEFLKVLAASVADLHYGFLSVGGLTAIGRGIFEIKKVNGTKLSKIENLYEFVYKQLKGEA